MDDRNLAGPAAAPAAEHDGAQPVAAHEGEARTTLVWLDPATPIQVVEGEEADARAAAAMIDKLV